MIKHCIINKELVKATINQLEQYNDLLRDYYDASKYLPYTVKGLTVEKEEYESKVKVNNELIRRLYEVIE